MKADDNAESGSSKIVLQIDGSERVRIYSGISLNWLRNTNATSFNTGGDDLVIGNGTDGQDAGITLYSHSTDNGSIFFNDTANTGVTGLIQYRHDSDAFLFHTASSERFRHRFKWIRLLIGTTTEGHARFNR